MKALFSTIIATVLFFNFVIAQGTATQNVKVNVPNVALVNVAGPTNGVTLSLTAPGTAGDWLTAGPTASNNESYLNVSSVKKSNERTISVKAAGVANGLTLKVASAAVKNAKGTLGAPGSEITLTTSDQTLISGIKSGYTGTGPGNGFQLTYTLGVDDNNLAELQMQEESVVIVTYTISE